MKDKIGIWTSIICLIHCLVFPLMATIFPLFIDLDIKVEILLISIALIIGTISFLDNALKHKYWLSLCLFLAGFIGLMSGVFLKSETLHVVGLMILILAHYKNYQKIKQSDGCHPHGCKH
jgi:hypothetical protein